MNVFKIDKYIAYYLGYLWADGNLYKSNIALEIVRTDYDQISDVIKKIGIKNIYYRHRKNSKRICKPSANIYISSVKISRILSLFDYRIKSNEQPTKILTKIPLELHRYFYLGLFDGDGSFSVKQKVVSFTYASTYTQKYDFIENLFKTLNIEIYNIYRYKKEKSRSSVITICNWWDLTKLIEYLYPNNYEFGLKRKYDKCVIIKSAKPQHMKRNIDKNLIKECINLNVIEMSKKLNCSIDHCYVLKREYYKSIGCSNDDIKKIYANERVKKLKSEKLTEQQILEIHNHIIVDGMMGTEIKKYFNLNSFKIHRFYETNYIQKIINEHYKTTINYDTIKSKLKYNKVFTLEELTEIKNSTYDDMIVKYNITERIYINIKKKKGNKYEILDY